MTNNEHEALVLIRRGAVHSRSDLARLMGISRPTASVIVESLLGISKIEELGAGPSTGGKMPVLLGALPGALSFIGLDLGYLSKITGVVLDESGRILQHSELEYDDSNLDQMVSHVRVMVRRLGRGRRIGGLGLALPGIVDSGTGRVLRSVNPVLLGDELHRRVSSLVPYPVRICNRSRAATYSEAFGGAAYGEQSFALISLGRSIGASFWMNGALFDGCHGCSGEIRNLRLRSGKTLEESISSDAVRPPCQEELLSACAEGFGQLLDIMDIRLLVLSGRFADFSEDFPQRLEGCLAEIHPCSVRLASYGRYSAARGVAFCQLEELIC